MGTQTGNTLSIFTGLNGNGNLSLSGNANVDYWPGNNGSGGANGEITGAAGSGTRGGVWYNDNTYARVSVRERAAITYATRLMYNGVRLVRTQ